MTPEMPLGIYKELMISVIRTMFPENPLQNGRIVSGDFYTSKLPNDFLEKFKDLTYNGHKIKYVNVEYNNDFSLKNIVIDLLKNFIN